MDGHAFDSIVRALAGGVTRRGALAGAVAALPPFAVTATPRRGRRGPDEAACVPNGRRCGKGSGKRGKPCAKCCSRFSIVPGNGQTRVCGSDAQCADLGPGALCPPGSAGYGSLCALPR